MRGDAGQGPGRVDGGSQGGQDPLERPLGQGAGRSLSHRRTADAQVRGDGPGKGRKGRGGYGQGGGKGVAKEMGGGGLG